MPPAPGMPLPMPAPPLVPPPASAPRRGGRWVLITLLLLALVGSAAVNLVLLGLLVAGAAAEVRQTVISGEGPDKVAVVGIDQLIDDDSAQSFRTVLREVEKDSAVKALVVEIDTPGGSADSADEMYHRLDRFRNSKHVPVVVAMRGMATSGGYYVSVAGDYLFAEPGCFTGNIGVLFPRFNVSQMIGKWGVSETTLTGTTPGHSYKNAGSMFQPPNPEDEKYLQELVDGVFAQFKAVVLAGRKGKLNDKEGDVFSGKAFIADDALQRGLIDKIGYPDEAYDYAAHLAGLTSRSVVRYAPSPTLLQMLTPPWNLGVGQTKGAGNVVTIDGVSVDRQTVEYLLSARPLLLWRGN